MAEVVTMSGDPLVTARSLLLGLADRDDVKHVLVAVMLNDNTVDVFNSRAAVSDVSYMASVTALFHVKLIGDTNPIE